MGENNKKVVRKSWTNERHVHFLNSMEASFVRSMFFQNQNDINNAAAARLDRYLPDTSDSTEDLPRERRRRHSASGLTYKDKKLVEEKLLARQHKAEDVENGDVVSEGQKRMIELIITGLEGHALSRSPVLEGEASDRTIHLAWFCEHSFVSCPCQEH